jgi:hypothetical protein
VNPHITMFEIVWMVNKIWKMMLYHRFEIRTDHIDHSETLFKF